MKYANKCPRCGDWPSCPDDAGGLCHICQRASADAWWTSAAAILADSEDDQPFICARSHAAPEWAQTEPIRTAGDASAALRGLQVPSPTEGAPASAPHAEYYASEQDIDPFHSWFDIGGEG